MNYFSLAEDTLSPKSPHSKIKHTRDDSSLENYHKFNTVQSCRRITTQQSANINKIHNPTKKQQNIKSTKQSQKNNNLTQTNSQPKFTNQLSNKNLKNLKLSNSVNKKIQSYLTIFSPKSKNIHPHNLSKEICTKDFVTNITQKSGLKKTTGTKTNIAAKVSKSKQDQKISPFVPFPNKLQQKKQKSPDHPKNIKKQSLNKSKVQKPLFKLQNEGKSKAFKTLQNEPIDMNKHRNSNKDQLSKKRKNTKEKMYHNLKMKTQQSMISCESTPSQIFTHDIEFLQLIGQGTFGKVYKGINKKTSEIVAVKKVFQDKKYKNRQIEIVSLVSNSNFIMKVLGTYMTYEQSSQKEYLNIVMKFYESDMFKDIQVKKTLSNMEIKIYTYQIFRGLLYLHSKKICHRDIKPQNILTNNMEVVICDFGSAKILNPLQKNLPYICSRCYRAPELIFGSTQYTTMIDIWSVGCVILQMIYGTPFFIGSSSIDHLIEVIKVLGTPTKTQVKEMNPEYDLKDYKFPNIKSKSFSQIFPNTDPLLISLLEQIMIYSPKQRLNAAEALVHEYFDELRQEKTYEKLCQTYEIADLFDFTPQQMKQNQHLYGQLVPDWYSKNHFTYFQNQQIEKNNTLKFYFD